MTSLKWPNLRLTVAMVAAWCAVTACAAAHYVWTHVDLPGNEGYERYWDFQLAMFALSQLPYYIGGLFGALLLLRHHQKTQRDEHV